MAFFNYHFTILVRIFNRKIQFKNMRIFIILAIALFLVGCNSNRYIFKEKFIDKLSEIPKDSILILDPVISMWRFSGNRDFNFPSVLGGRPDTVRKYLKQIFLRNSLDSNILFINDVSCIRPKLNSSNLGNRAITDSEFYKCLKIDSLFYNVFLYFSLDVTEVAAGSSEEFSNINAFIVILNYGQITYYKHFYSRRRSLRTNFPRNSVDRKEFPHFTSEQIKLVVDKITDDLMKKIN